MSSASDSLLDLLARAAVTVCPDFSFETSVTQRLFPETLEEWRGKYERLQVFIGAFQYLLIVSVPLKSSFVKEADIFADFHYRVHIVCIDNRGNVIFFGDITD